jgi:hypothetical protein
MGHFTREIGRITDKSLLLMSNRAASQAISESVRRQSPAFTLESSTESGWHSYKVSGAGVGGTASADAATIVENCYRRNPLPEELSPSSGH